VLGPDGPAYRPLAEIAPGDRVRVAPGERIAVDGRVLDGASDIDCSHVTGESAPEAVAEGGAVRAGTLNLSGALTLETTAVGDDSSLGAIQRLMAEAESRKSRVARLADQAATIYAPVVHLVALFTFIGWLWMGADWRDAAFIAIAVLIITCPCALGLAAPMAQATAAGALFRRGVMLKDGAALERLALVDTVVFDKTGTLTTGRPDLREPDDAAMRALPAAAALAAESRHPLAQALAERARALGLTVPPASAVREHPGLGVEGLLAGRPARLGRIGFAGDADADRADTTEVWFRVEGEPPVVYRFDDAPRADAAETAQALAAEGLALEVLSGDRAGPVRTLAQTLGVARWRAGVTPEEKIAHVRALGADGARVLMVGDGVNDAPALAAASVSMAPASAADVGRAAADLVFFGDALAPVGVARRLAVKTRAVILQNFAIAAGYNCIAIPLAVSGHASPLVAAVAMSSSSILVVANALRLQRVPAPPRPAPEARPAAPTRPAPAAALAGE
jgi:Cu2+-exporting ATPase